MLLRARATVWLARALNYVCFINNSIHNNQRRIIVPRFPRGDKS